MKRIRLMGVALIAIVALGALVSASAFAELPEILPVPTPKEPANFTSVSGGVVVLLTGHTSVVCSGANNKGRFTSQNAGTVEVEFKECKKTVNGKTSPCLSPGQAAETILTGGEEQVATVLPTGTLDLGLWIKPYQDKTSTEMLSFECGVIKFVILGSVFSVVDNIKGELLKDLEKFKELKTLWKEGAVLSEQGIKECMSLAALCLKEGKPNVFQLEVEFGKGHELAALIADATLKFEKEYEVHF